MRILTRKQLLQEKPGVIFREFEPFVWTGEWLRLEEPLPESNDFVYSEISPSLEGPSDQYENGACCLCSENTSREGMYESETTTYIVLDIQDIEEWIRLIQGRMVNVQCEFTKEVWDLTKAS